MLRRLLLTALVLATLTTSAHAAELLVSAAASLTNAFTDIEAAYEKAHPGTDVVMNFAASGALYRQIEQGAPVDVYASANQKWMNSAVDNGFAVKESRVDFARNALVLAVPAANPAGVSSVKDLLGDKVTKVAIGTPKTVPAGQYAKGALEKMGLWEKLEPKYIYGESVRQVLDYLMRGEVDAGFVYGTDAVQGGKDVKTMTEVELEKPVTYPIATMKKAPNPEGAKEFLAFVLGSEGQKILSSYGFKRP